MDTDQKSVFAIDNQIYEQYATPNIKICFRGKLYLLFIWIFCKMVEWVQKISSLFCYLWRMQSPIVYAIVIFWIHFLIAVKAKKNHKIKRYSLETFMFLSASNENVQGPSLVALCFNYRCCNIRKKNKRQQHNQARRWAMN